MARIESPSRHQLRKGLSRRDRERTVRERGDGFRSAEADVATGHRIRLQKRTKALRCSSYFWTSISRRRLRMAFGVATACLQQAAAQGLTFVTCDRRTIPPLLKGWAEEERRHGGVIFVDEKTISPSDTGGLVRALSNLARKTAEWDWT